MKGSFRRRLAARFSGTVALGMVAVAAGGWFALRYVLDREIDSSLLNVASIQASSVTESPTGEMRFHEWELTPEEAASIRDLNRYAQVWDGSGNPLLRTAFITRDLPLDSEALVQAVEGEIVWARQSFDGVPIRSLYYPLERRGVEHHGHVLQVAAPLLVRDATLRATAAYLAAIVLLVVAGTWVGAWWLAGSTVRPVHDIIDQAEEIRSGTLDRRISAHAELAEYNRLVVVLNTMLDRLQASFQAQRRFTQDASHELRGPLTAMRGEMEVALRRPRSTEEYEGVVRSSLEEVERLGRVSEELLTLARSDGGVMAPAIRMNSIDDAVRGGVDRMVSAFAAQGVTLEITGASGARIPFDDDLMARIIWNLLDNALEHSPEGGTVEIGTHRDGDWVVLQVGDAGPGVEPELRDRVFERFFRADPARGPRPGDRKGTGLGLSIVRALAVAHGGDVAVDQSRLGGALFVVRLPAPTPGT